MAAITATRDNTNNDYSSDIFTHAELRFGAVEAATHPQLILQSLTDRYRSGFEKLPCLLAVMENNCSDCL